MRSDPILDNSIETSEMKTPIDLHGFEHLLPLLNTPSYSNLQEININHLIEDEETKENVRENVLKKLTKNSFDNLPSEEEEEEIKSKEIRSLSLRNLVIKKDYQKDLTPLFDVVKIPNSIKFIKNQFGPLKSNSNWIGNQRSGNQIYPVLIKFLDINLPNGNGSGLLEINGLTEKYPKLITFFDIEIVGRGQYEFSTKRWGANQQSDESHWLKFPYYHQIKHQSSTSFSKSNDQVLFMRWKERFLDGNPKGKEIEGASFAGFYYACLDLTDQDNENLLKPTDLNLSSQSLNLYSNTNSNLKPLNCKTNQRISTEPLPNQKSNLNWLNAKIKAFYYHAKSEPYQELNLRLQNSNDNNSSLRSSATYQFC